MNIYRTYLTIPIGINIANILFFRILHDIQQIKFHNQPQYKQKTCTGNYLCANTGSVPLINKDAYIKKLVSFSEKKCQTYFFNAAILSSIDLILLSASACFLRSISITFAGALLTKFSLPNFFMTEAKKPC